MTTENDLEMIADQISDVLERFDSSEGYSFLHVEDQARFKRLFMEAKVLLDDILEPKNDFSANLVHTVNNGQNTFFDGPSYACVAETEEIIRGATNHVRRRLMVDRSAMQTARKPPYVDPSRLAALRAKQVGDRDLSRLAQLCVELNVAHENDCHMSVAMLVRAAVDHVPPIFGCRNFSEVANNYGGTSSFKKLMTNLNQSLRHIADTHLHIQARPKESIPTSVQVDFRSELDALLEEVLRLASATDD